jgi:hypothetical protein
MFLYLSHQVGSGACGAAFRATLMMIAANLSEIVKMQWAEYEDCF